ncbi:MAG: acetate--CoA ligase family protein [Thermodesulfobacteriota bacterium]
MKDLFFPSSVVVIGVSPQRANLGKEIARNLLEFQYTGVIHLVGLDGGVFLGRVIHRSLEEVPDPVDLAIILTPASTIPGLLAQCAKKGIRRVIIESGGFGEFSSRGTDLGREIQDLARSHRIRFIGPNCIGLLNLSNGLATPFATMRNVFRKGTVGIIAQSGGVALTLVNMFDSARLGFSKFAAIGNKLDVDENDILEYYVQDPETQVICMYLESVNDGRRLTRIARESPKPIVVHKANIGPLSSSIAQSHTDALANDDQVVDAAFRQCGIVRFQDIHGYIDFVKVLQLPRMRGRNMAIISRSGGHAVMAADAAYTYGFDLPPFPESFLAEVSTHSRAKVIRLANPLDLGDLFDFDEYVRIVEQTLQEAAIDGILFLHTYFAAIEGEASRRLLQDVAGLSAKYDKPVATCVYTENFEISRLHKEFDFPIFNSPGRAVHALDTSIDYYRRREFIEAQKGSVGSGPAYDRSAVKSLLDQALGAGRSPLLHEALRVVEAAGIHVPPWQLIEDPSGISDGFDHFPGPYALKAVASALSHKSDAGGVVLGLPHAHAMRAACFAMREKLGQVQVTGYLVQEMATGGSSHFELIIGAKRDPHFGPVILLGHGGTLVEILGKSSLRVAPLSPAEADQMIDDLPGSAMFRGARGKPPVDRNALKDAILRIAALITEFPEIDQIEVNPLVVSESGAKAVDARVFL